MLSTKFKSRRTPNAIWAASIVLAKHTYPNVTYPWPWAEKGVLKTIGLSHCSLSGRHIKNIQQELRSRHISAFDSHHRTGSFDVNFAGRNSTDILGEFQTLWREESFLYFTDCKSIGFHEEYRNAGNLLRFGCIRTFSDNPQLTIWTIM